MILYSLKRKFVIRLVQSEAKDFVSFSWANLGTLFVLYFFSWTILRTSSILRIRNLRCTSK